MTRVIMVTERYVPFWGGAENQLRQLLPRLRELGAEVEIVTRRWRRDLPARDSVDGVPVHRLGLPGEGPLGRVLFALHLLTYLLRVAGPQVVFHSHGVVSLGALVNLGSKPGGGRTIVKITTAGSIPQFSASILGRIVLALFKWSDQFVCISDEIADELTAIGVPKSRVARIPNGVDCSLFAHKSESDRREWRRKHGLSQEARLVVFSGRFVQRKGLITLIDAWQGIPGRHHNATLILLGSGRNQPDSVEEVMRRNLRNADAGSVMLLGEIAEPWEVLGVCDIFVLPSCREGLSNALLEAMACGLAPVVTDIGGNDQLVIHGETGLLVPPGDAISLREAIDKLLEQDALIASNGSAARSMVASRYSMDATAKQIANLYEKLRDKNLD